MAPVSILPGRIRFESPLIIGKIMDCRYLNESISSINGVLDAFVNHRTGRILIKFNETLVNKEALTQRIKKIMKSMPHKMDAFELMAHHRKRQSKDSARHFPPQGLIVAAAHILLPKPFNMLLPMAVNAIRR